jgi:hypothetical protein
MKVKWIDKAVLTGAYPMRARRRSSSSAMVAMVGSWLFLPASVALDDWLVIVGWSALPSPSCAPSPVFPNSGLPMVNDTSTTEHETGEK